MEPKLDFRTEAEFKQQALHPFYRSLDETMPKKWHRRETDKLLSIFKTRVSEQHWDRALQPFLQYRYASDILCSQSSSPEDQKTALKLFNKALKDSACPEFLKPKIMFRQAEAMRSGMGYSHEYPFHAYDLYTKIAKMAATPRELRDRIGTIKHSMRHQMSSNEELNHTRRAYDAVASALDLKEEENERLKSELVTAREGVHALQQMVQQQQQLTNGSLIQSYEQLSKQNLQLEMRLREVEEKQQQEMAKLARENQELEAKNQEYENILFRGGVTSGSAVLSDTSTATRKRHSRKDRAGAEHLIQFYQVVTTPSHRAACPSE